MATTTKKKAAASGSRDKATAYVRAKGEDYMSEGMVTHFRDLLKGLRAEVRAQLARAEDEPKHHQTSLPDEADQAAEEFETEMELYEIKRQRALLSEIDTALERLEEGDYGFCQSCGEEIGIPRLEVRPVATLCIDCKALEEGHGKR